MKILLKLNYQIMKIIVKKNFTIKMLRFFIYIIFHVFSVVSRVFFNISFYIIFLFCFTKYEFAIYYDSFIFLTSNLFPLNIFSLSHITFSVLTSLPTKHFFTRVKTFLVFNSQLINREIYIFSLIFTHTFIVI